MKNMNKIASIIIPVYNAESNIQKLVEGLRGSQYYRLLEIICVDDGSTDKSLEILQSLTKQIDNLLVLHQENQGVSSARNNGIHNASGVYVYFVDADDQINILEFDRVLREVVRDDMDLAIFGIRDVFHYKNNKLKTHDNYTADITYDEHLFFQDFGRLLNKHILYSPCNKLYKREIIETNNIQFDINLKICEDIMFNLQYFYHIEHAKMYPQYVYLYQHNEMVRDSGSTRYYDNELDIFLHVVDEITKLLVEKQVFEHNEVLLRTFVARKLSLLLNNAYSKNSSLSEIQKEEFIEQLYKKDVILNAIQDKRVVMEELDQKIILLLHRHHLVKGIYWLYKIRN